MRAPRARAARARCACVRAYRAHPLGSVAVANSRVARAGISRATHTPYLSLSPISVALRTALSEQLQKLGVHDGVALATAAVGETVHLVPLTGPNNNDLGGVVRLLACLPDTETIRVKPIVEGGSSREVPHARLLRHAAHATLAARFGSADARPRTRAIAHSAQLEPAREEMRVQGAAFERNEAHARANAAQHAAAVARDAAARIDASIDERDREARAAVASATAAARRAERAADVAIADARANADDATAHAETAEQRAARAARTIARLREENAALRAEADGTLEENSRLGARVFYLEDKSRLGIATRERDEVGVVDVTVGIMTS